MFRIEILSTCIRPDEFDNLAQAVRLVRLELVAHCEFLEWTDSSHVRHKKVCGSQTGQGSAPSRFASEKRAPNE